MLDLFIDKHRAVVDLCRIYAAQPKIQEILQRAKVYRPDNSRSERIRKRITRDFTFLTSGYKIAVILNRPTTAVIVFLLDVFAGLHDLDRSHKILCRIAERGAIIDIMGRTTCI